MKKSHLFAEQKIHLQVLSSVKMDGTDLGFREYLIFH